MSDLAERTPAYLMALMMWREARGESSEARRAIANVVLNRVRLGRWGASIEEVILRPFAFSSFNANDANAVKFPIRKHRLDWTAWEDCCRIAEASTARQFDAGEDPSKGATHYHSYPSGHPNWPAWAETGKLSARIGPFWFYRDVR